MYVVWTNRDLESKQGWVAAHPEAGTCQCLGQRTQNGADLQLGRVLGFLFQCCEGDGVHT